MFVILKGLRIIRIAKGQFIEIDVPNGSREVGIVNQDFMPQFSEDRPDGNDSQRIIAVVKTEDPIKWRRDK